MTPNGTAPPARSARPPAMHDRVPGWWLAALLAAFLAAPGCGSEEVKGEDASTDTGADTATAVDTSADADAAVDTADGANWTGKCAAGPSFCDDGNPCTIDHCDPLTGCFTEPRDCEDDDPCTIDACEIASGGCTHGKNDCDDGNVCTTGACDAAAGCIYQVIACDDGDACTSDGCSPASGCVYAPLDCDDHKTCTKDACDPSSGCTHLAPEGETCCESAVDCEDDNVCTQHACSKAGTCETTAIFGCCKADSDCDDGNPCTTDACTKAAGTCSNAYVPGPGCCQNDIECDDGDLCTADACFGGQCGHDVTCCKAAADCAPAAALGLCSEATCTGGQCGFVLASGADAACCKQELLSLGFEAGDTTLAKLSPSKNGVFSVAEGSSAEVHGGKSSLHYVVQTQAVAGGKTVARAALPTLELALGTEPVLRFWVRTQLNGGSLADKLRLRAETSIGARYIWQAKPVAGWSEVKIPLRAFAGRAATRKLDLVFEVLPGNTVWANSKAFIDDVVVDGGCTTTPCKADADCDDGLGATDAICDAGQCKYGAGAGYCENATPCNDKNNCTADSCGDNFGCVNVPLPDCCTKTAECDDDNPCTSDVCSGLKCKHTAKPGSVCCNAVADCDDSNPCTQDSCPVVGLPCAYTQTDPLCCIGDTDCADSDACTLDLCISNGCQHKQQCCATPADCADGDECTSDACESGICSFALLEKPGCCVPKMLDVGFEDGKTEPFVLQSQLATSKWQLVSGKQAKDGKSALWYGNLATGNFDDGQSSGTVTWKGVEIPKGEQTTLGFSLWMDTEMGTSYDRFEVFVTAKGKKVKVWDKNAPGFTLKTWFDAKVGLSAFAGETVEIVFSFDTTDGVANSGEGVYLDAVNLMRSCAAQSCNGDKDCDDGVASTTESCKSGSCSYTY